MTDDPIASLRPLIGTWKGEGHGEYPTIDPFDYRETVVIEALAKPVLSYAQRTSAADDGRPLHAESGWFRMVGDAVELVIAQPTGITEALSGHVEEGRITLVSSAVCATPGALDKGVLATRRIIEIEGDVMRYRLAMAAVGQPLTHHLSAELRRVVTAGA